MDRRSFALKGLALAPASLLLATTKADARKKKSRRRPKPCPAPPKTMLVTQTFENRTQIQFNDLGPANPYPSKIQVSGLTAGRIVGVNMILHGFTYDRPVDAALMLVSPSGKGALMMQNVGGNHPVNGLVITLSDLAEQSVSDHPDRSITSSTYKPTSFRSASDLFPAPAPQGVTATALATFNGENPNGEWKLFAADDAFAITGVITSGWSLVVTAEVANPSKPKPPKNRRRKKRNRHRS